MSITAQRLSTWPVGIADPITNEGVRSGLQQTGPVQPPGQTTWNCPTDDPIPRKAYHPYPWADCGYGRWLQSWPL